MSWNDTKTSRENRQARALERQASARTPQAQLAHLDANGFVATKERAKLAKKLANPKAVRAKVEPKNDNVVE
jgi:hypothetical protein